MNTLDIVLIAILALVALRGLSRGLIQEMLSLIALIAALFVASNYNQRLEPFLRNYLSGETTIHVASYIILFVGTMLVIRIVARLLSGALDVSLLGWLNHGAGGVFGLAEGALVGLIILWGMATFLPNSALLQESKIAAKAKPVIALTARYAPQSLRSTLSEIQAALPTPSGLVEETEKVPKQAQ